MKEFTPYSGFHWPGKTKNVESVELVEWNQQSKDKVKIQLNQTEAGLRHLLILDYLSQMLEIATVCGGGRWVDASW